MVRDYEICFSQKDFISVGFISFSYPLFLIVLQHGVSSLLCYSESLFPKWFFSLFANSLLSHDSFFQIFFFFACF